MSFKTRNINHSLNKGENNVTNVNTIASYRKSRQDPPQILKPKPLPNFLDRLKRDEEKINSIFNGKTMSSNKENQTKHNYNILLKKIKELESENDKLKRSLHKITEENKFLKDEIVMLNQIDSSLSPNVSSSSTQSDFSNDFCNILNMVKEMDKESLEKLIVEVYVRLEELKDEK